MRGESKIEIDHLITSYREQQNFKEVDSKQISQLKSIINLRNKEIVYLSTQIVSIKQESNAKIAILQNSLTDLKKQSADLRFNLIKSKRIESQNCQKEIQASKNELLMLIKKKQIEFQEILIKHKKDYEQQLSKEKFKNQVFVKALKEQNNHMKKILSQNNEKYEQKIRKLEQEKGILFVDKRQAIQQLQAYKESLEKIKQQFKTFTQSKDRQDSERKAEISNFRTADSHLKQKILALEMKLKDNYNENLKVIANLKQEIQNLQMQNDKYKKLLAKKNDQMLSTPLKSTSRTKDSRQFQIKQIRDCKHEGYIIQLQKNIQLKNYEIQTLKNKLNEWRAVIGFQKPLTERINEISSKWQSANQMQSTLISNIKSKSRKS